MSRDPSQEHGGPGPGVPAWIVAAGLGITQRQVYRLEQQGRLRSWVEGVARVYGLDDVRRLARERRRLAGKDSRIAAPSDDAMRVLDGLRRSNLCGLLAQHGLTPEQGFWQFVAAAGQTGRAPSPSEWKLMGALADLAMRVKAGT